MKTDRWLKGVAFGLLATVLAVLLGPGVLAAPKRGGKPPPEPVPDSPPARAWHGMAANAPGSAAGNFLYVFAGTGQDQGLRDLWRYDPARRSWSLAPIGKQRPGIRLHPGFSCGGGQCVTMGGVYISLIDETWVYDEGLAAWSRVACRRAPCPAGRRAPAMAYHGEDRYHLLFGGSDGNGRVVMNDTWRLQAGAWTRVGPGVGADGPAARWNAAMAYVPGQQRIVLFGGQVPVQGVLCDLWSWNGSAWDPVSAANPGPCLHGHNLAWDGDRLLVAGGYVDTSDTPNRELWTFVFDSTLSGSWVLDEDLPGCYASLHAYARMARDPVSGDKVFFGGIENDNNGTAVVFGDTVHCQ